MIYFCEFILVSAEMVNYSSVCASQQYWELVVLTKNGMYGDNE